MWANAARSGSLEDIQLLRIACFKRGNREQLLALENCIIFVSAASGEERSSYGWESASSDGVAKRASGKEKKTHSLARRRGKKSRNPSLTLTFAASTQCWVLLSSCSPNKNLIKYLKSRWRGICKSKSCDLGSSKHFPHIITSYADLREEKKERKKQRERVLEGNSATWIEDDVVCDVGCCRVVGCLPFGEGNSFPRLALLCRATCLPGWRLFVGLLVY